MSVARAPRVLVLIVLCFTLIAGLAPAPVSAAGPSIPLPARMAAVGDSITQAASTAGSLGTDAPQNSWSTGTSSTVNSHFLRLRTLAPAVTASNLSVSGAKMANLKAQMDTVLALEPDPGYLTILMGGNDLCTDTVTQMTSVTNFRAQFQLALETVRDHSPNTRVYVVSIPNVYQLWNLFKGNFWARFIWATAGICQSLLANPTSTQSADVQRRAAVRQRNIDYNTQLAQVCSAFVNCLFDGNASFNTTFTTSDVSGDYFHPSVAGQTKLASVSWSAGYTWTSTPPPPPQNLAPTADFNVSCAGLTCSFTDNSSDDVGIDQWSWDFGDGGTSAVANPPPHLYAAPGTYSVTLTATDGAGAADSVMKPVSVTAPSATTTFVQSLVGQGQSTGKNTWTATVTVVVADTDGRLVPEATVNATWSSGAGATCITDGSGACSVTSDNLNKRKFGSVTYTVTGVDHATLTYDDTGNLMTDVTVIQP